MTYDNSHRDRRRYGRREDEPCGSWRTMARSAPLNRARYVCGRPYHADPFHMTSDRAHWWLHTDREPEHTEDTLPGPVAWRILLMHPYDRKRANHTEQANPDTEAHTMTSNPEPLTRPDGKPYHPRSNNLRVKAWGDDAPPGDCGVIVFGTLDPDRARPLAQQACAHWYESSGVQDPRPGWYRDAYDRGERRWIEDDQRGAPGVTYTWNPDA